MRVSIKWMGLLLAVLTLLSVAACALPGDGTETENASDVAMTGAVAETSGGIGNLPDNLDFNGATVVIHTRDDNDSIREVFADNPATVIEQAVYNRNVKIEEYLKVKIKAHPSRPWQKYNEALEMLQASILANDAAYDIVAGWSAFITTLGTTDYFMNLYDFDYLDFDQPWWNSYATKALTLGKKTVFATGDIALSCTGAAQCILFNKKLQKDWDVEDLYQTVLDGDWTFEKMNSLVKEHYYDNGDTLRNDADSYGIAIGPTNDADGFLQASDIQMFSYDENGLPYYNPEAKKLSDLIQKMYSLMYENEGTFLAAEDGPTLRDMFMNDKALLHPTQFYIMELYISKMESDYGILPFPKYDESQKEYLTRVQDGVSLWCIPLDAPSALMSSAVMEAMAVENYTGVSPVYYNVAMKNRYARDNSDIASRVMDLIMDGRYFNFACLYNNNISRPWDCARILMENQLNNWSYWNDQYANSISIMTQRLIEKLGDE